MIFKHNYQDGTLTLVGVPVNDILSLPAVGILNLDFQRINIAFICRPPQTC